MQLDREKQQELVRKFRQKQLTGLENLTQTPEIIADREKKQSDLDNLVEATNKFFNNDTTIKSN